MKKRIFDKFFDKIKFITKKSTSKDIAKLLGLADSTFCEKKRRDQIPYEEVVKFCKKYDVDIAWLLDMQETNEQINNQIKIINKNRAKQTIDNKRIIRKNNSAINIQDFTTINNIILKENHLSLPAIGLLTYILSKPKNWQILPKDLAVKLYKKEDSKASYRYILELLSELLENNYISRTRHSDGTILYTLNKEQT